MKILILFLISSGIYAQASTCKNNRDGLNCLAKNFSQMYSNSYEETFNILNSAKESVLQCKDKKVVSDFFKLNKVIKGNAEVEGFYAETIEELVILKSECFVSSLRNEKSDIQASILAKLKNPMFKNKQEIESKIDEFGKKSKYKGIVEMYKKQ